jgi:hypothetical protein
VERRFVADRPDALWVSDITQQRTNQGWVYCAFVLDTALRLWPLVRVQIGRLAATWAARVRPVRTGLADPTVGKIDWSQA